jgi:hypothetical protein
MLDRNALTREFIPGRDVVGPFLQALEEQGEEVGELVEV